MIYLHSLWVGLGVETKSALIGAVATLLAAVGGFGGLILQVRSQGKQNRASVEENERRRLKAQMYEESVTVCNELSDRVVDYCNKLRVAGSQIQLAAKVGELAASSMSPDCSFESIRKSYGDCYEAAVRFVVLVERRRIIDPRMTVFRTVMNATLHDMRQNFEQRLVRSAWHILPSFAPDGRQNRYQPLSEVEAKKADAEFHFIADQVSNLGCHLDDFLIEMQNHLLGDLFGHKVPHRVPIDPKYRVITLADAEEIEQHIIAQSAWGKMATDIEAKMRAGLVTVEGQTV